MTSLSLLADRTIIICAFTLIIILLLLFLSRLLDLRNMPFVAGRRFNWFTDILPVASETLRETANITQGDLLSCQPRVKVT